jgi:hypothetical protein
MFDGEDCRRQGLVANSVHLSSDSLCGRLPAESYSLAHMQINADLVRKLAMSMEWFWH